MPGRRSKATKGALAAPRARAAAGARAATFASFVARGASAAEKIGAIRRGVRARVVDEMVAYLAVPKSVVFAVLHTPDSTAHRRIRDDRPLDAAVSERVVRVADVARLAEEAFGGRGPATRWLKTPNRALGDATPLSLLDTEPGAAEVRRILAAISHGGVF
jgi:putative toxin-antitoxin system antitoxin component (TIGR02293 family)